jgi:signal transduction histidine kinase
LSPKVRFGFIDYLKSRCRINLRYLGVFFLIGSIPAVLIEKNSISSLRSALLWYATKAIAVLTTYLYWSLFRYLLVDRYRTQIYDLILIGGTGGAIGGVVVHQLASVFSLEHQATLIGRIASASVVGALWLPSMSTANNSLRKFKEQESQIKARLLSQDQLKFKQSMVFQFLTSSFYRSIQQKLSVTALEAREILDRHLNESSSREAVPELVANIATKTFRDLSHSIQDEITFGANLGEIEKTVPFWGRLRKFVSFPSALRFNPILDAFPYSLIVSLFCAGYISRNSGFALTVINVSVIFISNFAVLKAHAYLSKNSDINLRFLSLSSVLSTAIAPPILLEILDRSHFLGLSFQGSNFYFFSYFILALVMSFLGYVALLIKITFHEMEDSLQSQYRQGIDKEKIVNNEIARITSVCAKYIHGNLQSSLVSLSGSLKQAVKNGESERTEEIIDEILHMLQNPELELNRNVDDLYAEVLKKISLWEGLVDIHPEIQIDEHQFSPQTITQVMDCVEEMISNAVRHGKASAIKLSIQRTADGTLVLICTDNGQFDPHPQGGLGFNIYQEASNGDWTISRTPEDNLTVVRILINS